MKKAQLTMSILMMVVLVFWYLGCAKAPAPVPSPKPSVTTAATPAATPAPAPAPTAKPAASPTAAPVKLTFKFADYRPPAHNQTKWYQTYCERIKKATDGQVEFTLYSAESLCKMAEQYDFTVSGAADLSTISPLVTPALAFNSFSTIPGWVNDVYESAAQHKKLNSIIERETSKRGLRLLFIQCLGETINFWSRKGPINTLADFKGVRVRSPGGFTSDALVAWGCAPVTIPSPEQYTALQRGTADATYTGTSTYLSYRLYEVASYCLETKDPLYPTFVSMNMKAWNTIPANLQAKILEVGKSMEADIPVWTTNEYEDIMKDIAAKGTVRSETSPALRQQMRDASKGLWDTYLKTQGALGKEIYDVLFSK